MGKSWIVREGYLQLRVDGKNSQNEAKSASARTKEEDVSYFLADHYFVLQFDRKIQIFQTNRKENLTKTVYVQAFSGWDGDTLLKLDSYGIEILCTNRTKEQNTLSLYMAAHNRRDLMQWCRAFVAVLDPQSELATELIRERRKFKKEVKRNLKLQEEKAQKWKELREKKAQEEYDRQLAREQEINNMTPLERINDFGSLDDETIRTLEKRQARLQRRRQSAIGRVNKTAYRRRLEGAIGGKIDSMQPLQSKPIETKPRERVELPPPGQFFQKVSGIGDKYKLETTTNLSATDRNIASRVHTSNLKSVHVERSSKFYDEETPLPPPTLHSSKGTKQPFLASFSDDESMDISVAGSTRSRRLSSFIPPPPPPPADDESHHSEMDHESHIEYSDGRKSEDGESGRSEKSFLKQLDRTLKGADGVNSTQRLQRRIKSTSPTSVTREKLQVSDLYRNETTSNAKHGDFTGKPTRRKGLFDDSSDDSSESQDDGKQADSYELLTHRNAHNSTRASSSTEVKPTFLAEVSKKSPDSARMPGSMVSDTREHMVGSCEPPIEVSKSSIEPLKVSYISSTLMQNSGKKTFCMFKYSFQNDSVEHIVEKSYKDLKSVHSRLMQEFGARPLPKFPSKYWYRDNLKAENMRKRALELLQYLQSLLSIPGIIENERFRLEFDIANIESIRETTQSKKDGLLRGIASGAKKVTETLESRPLNPRRSNSKGQNHSRRLFASSDSSDGESMDEEVKFVSRKASTGNASVARKGSTLSTGSSAMLQSDIPEYHTVKQSDQKPEPVHEGGNQESKSISKKALLPFPNGMSNDLLEAIKRGKSLQKMQDSKLPSSNGFQHAAVTTSSAIVGSTENGSASNMGDNSSAPKLANVSSTQQVHSVSDAIQNALAMRKVFVEFEERSDAMDSDDDWDD
uniref:Uncharacterized protein AlNc14C68G4770 n=1 Tax=Albugo laibachii Nc14 TaxID=890382 RepID=F0WDQ0_9STRA|nr:conserved hypothetical protein [Albugo laibachii Nc14]|eukprot:CCA19326.1 conserved hypothetical protein [Albugo laibachii Nc14]